MKPLDRKLASNDLLFDIQINKIWQEIEGLHYAFCETIDDPYEIGYNIDEYISYERQVYTSRKNITATCADATQQTTTVQLGFFNLPTISIPKFSGGYIK